MAGTQRPSGPGDRETAAQQGDRVRDEDHVAEQRFIEGLVVRGETVPEGTDPLPPGATHEVVGEAGGVPATVRRRRFSARG
jgi:hypothetical protein